MGKINKKEKADKGIRKEKGRDIKNKIQVIIIVPTVNYGQRLED